MMPLKKTLWLIVLFAALAGCVPAAVATATSIHLLPTTTALPIETPTPVFTPTITPTATPDTRPLPRYWTSWPINPTVSSRTIEIYLRGVQMGVTPRTFSVIGDCQSEPNVFLGIYATDRYSLGDDEYLQATIDDFRDSFSHKSVAVRDGLSAPSALSPIWADHIVCQSTENPVQCELRIYKPMIVFINLGTNWQAGASADAYEADLHQIVELVIAGGAIPVLSTKADNVEGDRSLNLATARVAYDYDIPLWNFWAAADYYLPNHGLDIDRGNIYLTSAALDLRSFMALKTLDTIWQALKTVYGPGS